MSFMKQTEIEALIDKAIGKRGLIRTPAWWVRKIFYELIDWVASSLTRNKKEIQQDVNKSLEKSLPYIIVYSMGGGHIVMAGKAYSIPARSIIKIPYQETFKWTSISNIQLIDFRGASICPKDLSHLFENETGLFNLDLSPLDTSEVTDMSYMFANYSGRFVKFGKLNTANVKDMSYMFKGSKFQQIDRTGDNSVYGRLEKAVGMYEGCSAYFIYDTFIEGYNEVDFTGVFRGCAQLQHINPRFSPQAIPQVSSSLSFGKVISLKEAFKGCEKLSRLFVSGTASAADGFESMFEGCGGLTYLDLGNYFDTQMVTSLKDIFKGCSAIESLYLGTRFFSLNPKEDIEVDFSDLIKWVDSSVKTSLVDNSRNRATGFQSKITIKLSKETYNVLTEDQLTTITNKGYTIISV